MFNVNEMIVYARSGICKIERIESKSFSVKNSMENKCYVLKPIYDSSSTVYVPVDNDVLTSMMRNILTKQEIDELLFNVKDEVTDWVNDQRERTQKFRRILSGGITKDMLVMISSLVEKEKELAITGKKLCSSDDAVLKEAKREINQEFAYALGIELDGVEDYVVNSLN